MIEASITVKSFTGSYTTQDYTFSNQEEMDDWFSELSKDNTKGKVIGIHSIKTI